MENNNIVGWGVDANPKDRPSYPYWKPAEKGTGAHWEHTPQQPGFNDLLSLERPKETSTFNPRIPPRGFSGVIRRFAFEKFSEGMIRHWMLLLFADRVDMVEGVFSDLSRGHVPNVYREMGLGSELKYNKKKFVQKSALAGICFMLLPLGIFFWMRSGKRIEN